MGEVVEPQLAVLVDMSDSDCTAIVDRINFELEQKNGYDDVFAIWYELDKATAPHVSTDMELHKGRVAVDVKAFIAQFVEAGTEED